MPSLQVGHAPEIETQALYITYRALTGAGHVWKSCKTVLWVSGPFCAIFPPG